MPEKKSRRRDADACDRDGRAPQHRKYVAMTFLEPLLGGLGWAGVDWVLGLVEADFLGEAVGEGGVLFLKGELLG